MWGEKGALRWYPQLNQCRFHPLLQHRELGDVLHPHPEDPCRPAEMSHLPKGQAEWFSFH